MAHTRARLVYDGISAISVVVLAAAGAWAAAEPRVSRERPATVVAGFFEPLSLDGAESAGDESAPLALVIFSDFQCPFCKAFARNTLPAVIDRYVRTGKVRLSFRHLPLDTIHSEARRAAELAECARGLGRFWEFHDAAFADPRGLVDDWEARIGRAAGLDPAAFETCAVGDAAARVREDGASAALLDITSTPTVILGPVRGGRVEVARLMPGLSTPERIGQEIESLLDSSRAR